MARRLGANPAEIATRIEEDVMRRTRYPVHEIHNEDGTITFVPDLGEVDGPNIARR